MYVDGTNAKEKNFVACLLILRFVLKTDQITKNAESKKSHNT